MHTPQEYSLEILSRDYSRYQFVDTNSGVPLEILPPKTQWTPIGYFHGDVFEILITDTIDGPVWTMIEWQRHKLPSQLAGVIDYESKYSFPPSKKGISTYLFHPLHSRFPTMLVSSASAKKYNYKNILATVSVVTSNSVRWEKYPHATLISEIGLVSQYESYEEALAIDNQIPIKTKHTNHSLFSHINHSVLERIKKEIVTRNIPSFPHPIYTIDPPGCRDVDDGFSMKDTEDVFYLDIHIADVYSLLDIIGIRPDHFTRLFSSIYLPTRIIPMLPEYISCNLGSLLEGQERLLLSCHIEYIKERDHGTDYSPRVKYSFVPCRGRITRNLEYNQEDAQSFLSHATHVSRVYSLLTGQPCKDIVDTHQLIEVFMVLYNYLFAKHIGNDLGKEWLGRCCFSSENVATVAKYQWEKPHHITPGYHSFLNLDRYTHASSPLRRWVDLKNQETYYLQSEKYMKTLLEPINDQSRRIKVFQRKCATIHLAMDLYHNHPRGKSYEIVLRDVEAQKNRLCWQIADSNTQFYTNIDTPEIYHAESVSFMNDEHTHAPTVKYVSKDHSVRLTYEIGGRYHAILYGDPNVLSPSSSIRCSPE